MRTITFPYRTYRILPCPIVPLGLQGPNGWMKTEAYVDSGAFISVFTVADAQRIGLRYQTGEEAVIRIGDGTRLPVYVHQLPIQLGNQRFNAAIGFSPRLGVGFNLLGRQGIFTHFDVTFSDTRQRVAFQPVRSHR